MLIIKPMKRCTYVALSLFALMPSLALAQQSRSFAALQSVLKIGDSVRVTDSSGKVAEGRIADVSVSALKLLVAGRQQDMPESGIREVKRRRPDPRWNGALIGAAIGALAGAAVKQWNCGSTDCGEGGLVDPGFYVFGAGIGAGAGALVDRSIKRFDTVFVRPPTASRRSFKLTPILSKKAKGLELWLRF